MSKLILIPILRVSTEDQGKKGESLTTQGKRAIQCADFLGATIPKECLYEAKRDNGIPTYKGRYVAQEQSTPGEERAILDRFLDKDIDKWKGKNVAIWFDTLDRLGRDTRFLNKIWDTCKWSDIRIFEGTREYDPDNPDDQTQFEMGGVMAQSFALKCAYKSMENRIEKLKRGVPVCGALPYGREYNFEREE